MPQPGTVRRIEQDLVPARSEFSEDQKFLPHGGVVSDAYT